MANGEIQNVKSLLVHHTEHGTVTAKIIKITGRLYVGLSRVLTPKDDNETIQSKGVFFPLYAWKRFLEILPELDDAVKGFSKEEQQAYDEAHKNAILTIEEHAKPLAASTPKKEVSNASGRTSIEEITKNWATKENVAPATRALIKNEEKPVRKPLKRKLPECGMSPLLHILDFLSLFFIFVKDNP